MKQFLFLLLVTFAFSHMSFAQTVKNPIVDVNQAEGFGLWRVYNTGTEIYLVDSQGGAFIRVTNSSSNIAFFTTEREWFSFSANGSASSHGIFPSSDSWVRDSIQALNTEISAHIQDGLFGFGPTRFMVNGDSLTIFNEGDFNPVNNTVIPQTQITTINKFSNAVLHEGSNTNSNFGATVIVDANDIPGPARILGDCVTTYSAEEQKLTVPCLRVNNDSAIYEIDLHQILDTLNFSADLPTFNRVQ